MEALKRIVFLTLLLQASLLPMLAFAADADPIQDFCVADGTSKITVNGLVCKNAADVKVSDFVFHGLNKPGNTNNPTANAVTPVFAAQLPGLNTLGISLARLDFAQGGINVPHTHPRATEVLTVLQGELYVGFVSTANQLFATTLYAGDVFVFPKALVHFQLNVGKGAAVALSGLSSQNPGVQQVGRALFGANPPVSDVVLEKAFGLNQKGVQYIRNNFKA
jgi:quercetin dioxygenase-like cupin family protein